MTSGCPTRDRCGVHACLAHLHRRIGARRGARHGHRGRAPRRDHSAGRDAETASAPGHLPGFQGARGRARDRRRVGTAAALGLGADRDHTGRLAGRTLPEDQGVHPVDPAARPMGQACPRGQEVRRHNGLVLRGWGREGYRTVRSVQLRSGRPDRRGQALRHAGTCAAPHRADGKTRVRRDRGRRCRRQSLHSPASVHDGAVRGQRLPVRARAVSPCRKAQPNCATIYRSSRWRPERAGVPRLGAPQQPIYAPQARLQLVAGPLHHRPSPQRGATLGWMERERNRLPRVGVLPLLQP